MVDLDSLPWEPIERVPEDDDAFDRWFLQVTGLLMPQRMTSDTVERHPEVPWDDLWITKEPSGLTRTNLNYRLTPVTFYHQPGFWLLENTDDFEFIEVYRETPLERLL